MRLSSESRKSCTSSPQTCQPPNCPSLHLPQYLPLTRRTRTTSSSFGVQGLSPDPHTRTTANGSTPFTSPTFMVNLPLANYRRRKDTCLKASSGCRFLPPDHPPTPLPPPTTRILLKQILYILFRLPLQPPTVTFIWRRVVDYITIVGSKEGGGERRTVWSLATTAFPRIWQHGRSIALLGTGC